MKTVEITVGIFMVAAILSLLMLALQVSGLSFFFKEDGGYKIKAEFSNIGSLKIKGKVTVAGVVIGRVVNIKLDPDTFNATVWLAIDPIHAKKLPYDSRASILTAGLLGDNYISLTPGFEENKFLQEGDIIPMGSTDSAVVLEQLISKFLAGQASGGSKKSDPKTGVEPVSVPVP